MSYMSIIYITFITYCSHVVCGVYMYVCQFGCTLPADYGLPTLRGGEGEEEKERKHSQMKVYSSPEARDLPPDQPRPPPCDVYR